MNAVKVETRYQSGFQKLVGMTGLPPAYQPPVILETLRTFGGPALPRPNSVITFASLGYPRSLVPTTSEQFCFFVRFGEQALPAAKKTKPAASLRASCWSG